LTTHQSETGWVDLMKRMYDGPTARFTTIDPSPDVAGQESLTTYQYGWNNPLRYPDPNGDCPDCEDESAILSYQLASLVMNTVKDLALSSVNTVAIATGIPLRLKEGDDGLIYLDASRLQRQSFGQQLRNVGSDVLDVANVGLSFGTGGSGSAVVLFAKTGGKVLVTNALAKVGKEALHKNNKDATGNFVLYSIEEGKKVLKYGKAKADDVMPTTGKIRRIHESERKAKNSGFPNAVGDVVQELGVTTTGKATDAEAALVRESRAKGNKLELNKEKDKRYHN
jgi:RHS repeat-associated protein